jgi:hypothetical protein
MLARAQADLNNVKANAALLLSETKRPFADFAQAAHAYGLTE